jgi:hypothetical protein
METSKATLLTLSEARLAEARALLAARLWSGAYYLAGYSLEMLLKAHIADRFKAGVIPELAEVKRVYTHKLVELVSLAKLQETHVKALQSNREFAAHWSVVAEWNEQSRYSVWDETAATALLHAITAPGNGVMAWLIQHL